MAKTATLTVSHKDPDGLWQLSEDLELSDKKRDRYLEFGEYCTIRLEVDRNMNIVGGKFLPVGK